MQKSIIIGGDVYSIASLCRKYNFSYKKASHLYNQGYRGEELLNKLKKDQIEGQIIIDGKVFKSRLKAAKHFGISPTTFYRYERKGEIDKLIKRKKLLDKFDLN